MQVIFEFSEQQQSFHYIFPKDKTIPNTNGYSVIADQVESETASEFVYHMNRYRFNGNMITEEFCKAKWESFLSKQSSVTSK